MASAITVSGLSKRYQIGARVRDRTVREALTDAVLGPVHRLRSFGRSSHRPEDAIWALREVSFEVAPGEVLGVVGRNGAGKSTLLKILSRITDPTEGTAELAGRIGSLLEVGTGFHLELTGRENVYLSGAILGMRKAEIDRKLDEIIDFSGIETFIDTPVKRYSSGMRVRLGFAVAAHLEPEILLIDEVLAVGDVAFQRRCLGKMEDIGRGGRTVLFVSHNMAAVRHLCTRGLALHDGRVLALGDADEAVDAYLARMRAEAPEAGASGFRFPVARPEPPPPARVACVEVLDEHGEPPAAVCTGDCVRLRVHFECAGRVTVTPLVTVSTPEGARLLGFGLRAGAGRQLDCEAGTHRVDVVVPGLPLSAGRHVLGAALRVQGEGLVHEAAHAGEGEVSPRDIYGSGDPPSVRWSPIALPHSWEVPAGESGLREIG